MRTVSPAFLPEIFSTWAACSGTSGNLSPTLTLSLLLSWAAAVRHRPRAAATAAARATRRNMGDSSERDSDGREPTGRSFSFEFRAAGFKFQVRNTADGREPGAARGRRSGGTRNLE